MNYSKMKYIKLFEETNKNDILDILCELVDKYGYSIKTWYKSYELVSNAPQDRYKDGNLRPKCSVSISIEYPYELTAYDIDNKNLIIENHNIYSQFGRDLLEVGIMIGLRINDVDKWAEIIERNTDMYDYLDVRKIKLPKVIDNHFAYLKKDYLF